MNNQVKNLENYKISLDIKGKNGNNDFFMFPNILLKELGIKENTFAKKKKESILKIPFNMPLSAVKILHKILDEVSIYQFRRDNPKNYKQYSLFDEELATDGNSYIKISFPVKSVFPGRNYNDISKGIIFLMNYKNKERIFFNNKGKKIRTYGGILKDATVSEGKINLILSVYWYHKFVDLSFNYSKLYSNTIYKLTNSKQFLFLLFISKIAYHQSEILINYNVLNEMFNFNYKTPSLLKKNFFNPLKKILDKYSNVSFNTKVKKENILVKVYYTKEIDLKLDDKINYQRLFNYKKYYWKKKHLISDEQLKILDSYFKLNNKEHYEIFTDAYKLLVKTKRKQKIKMNSLTGERFLNEFQLAIKKYWINKWEASKINKTAFHKFYNRNNYPKIIL